MSKTPFVFGKLVQGSAFINRSSEIKVLKQNFVSEVNTVLISPRRWGKSSLVEKAAKECSAENKAIKFCYIDLFEVKNETEFYEKLIEEVLKQSSSRYQTWIKDAKEFLKTIVPNFSIGIDPQSDFKVKLQWEQAKKSRSEMLSLPEKIAHKKNIKFVICVDEFQKAAQIKDGLDFQQQLRSVWQRQKNCTYCLYGSQRHIVNELFQSQSMPFYRFGTLINLNKIERRHWPPFIYKGFSDTGKKINEELVERIISITQNHPYYVQQLSHQVWLNTDKDAKVETLDIAVDELLAYNSITYHKDIDGLTPLQFNLLKAIANKVQKIKSKNVLEKYNLGASGNIHRTIESLVKKEIVDTYLPTLTFIDPMFELWFKKRFLKV